MTDVAKTLQLTASKPRWINRTTGKKENNVHRPFMFGL